MISCDNATQTTNLYYSALKFLNFEGIIWSGDFLPIKLNSLGEIFQINIILRRSDGQILPAIWERQQLIARFDSGYTYNLEMRIEYCLPIQTWKFEPDFQSIHPKKYLMALDFSCSTLPHSHSKPGILFNDQKIMLGMEPKEDIPSEHGKLSLHQQGDYFSLQYRDQGNEAFCHSHFPTLFLE